MDRIDGRMAYQPDYQRNIHDTTEQINGRLDSQTTEKESTTGLSIVSSTEPGLSQQAKDLLSEMKQKYGDMDFFVADYSNDEEAQKYLARGQKDYSVLIDPDLLEKMAADESVKEQYMGVIDSAREKISEAKAEIDKLNETDDAIKKADIRSIGFSVKEDGSISFFAELERSVSDQKKRIEKSREEKRTQEKNEEKKAKERKEKEREEKRIKRGLVHGDTIEELFKKIQEFDWDKVSQKVRSHTGGLLDLTV